MNMSSAAKTTLCCPADKNTPPDPAGGTSNNDAPMSRFEQAVARAAARVGAQNWLRLLPQDRTAAIYRELRGLDAECSPSHGKRRTGEKTGS